MKKTMEKTAVLSLSLMLVSAFSVSSALPEMLNFFGDYPREQVELLISITSFAIMVTIALNTWMSRYIKERASIICGILLMVFGGITPVFVQKYGVIFISRIFLGLGIGLINARAINMINDRYEGDERATLLGFRGSAEVLGNAVLTLIAGRLLLIRWNYAFAVYLTGIPILLMYLLFIPAHREEETAIAGDSVCFGKGQLRFTVFLACFAWMVICINCSNTMRIPSLVLEKGYGTEADASVVLSLMLAVGIAAGVFFGKLEKLLGEKLMALGMICFGVGMAVMAYAWNLLTLSAGAAFAGIAYSILTTCAFYKVGSGLPKDMVNVGTSVVLVGCNLGAFSSPWVLKLIGMCSEKMTASFLVYGTVTGVLGIGYFILGRENRDGH